VPPKSFNHSSEHNHAIKQAKLYTFNDINKYNIVNNLTASKQLMI